MSKLYLPIGMLGSGKSTWAREFIKKHPNTKIVAGDDIRYMLAGGKEYTYDRGLEPIVYTILIETATILLRRGYDVILDECYCSLNREMRKRVQCIFMSPTTMITAVLFPTRDMKDHIEDKVTKGLRGKTVSYWKRVFCEMKEIYEPFNLLHEPYFNRVIEKG